MPDWKLLPEDRQILRELAKRRFDLASSPEEREKTASGSPTTPVAPSGR